MLAEPNSKGGHTPKLRTACENCRQSKVKCNLSGKNMCIRCLRHGLQCQYGFANRSGKPKGSKNRATLRKMGQLPEDRSGRGGLGRKQTEFIVDQKCHFAEQLNHINYGVDQSMGTVCCQKFLIYFVLIYYRVLSRTMEGFQRVQEVFKAH